MGRKEEHPFIFKILQFLLLYIRYDVDINNLRVREHNDRAVLSYLSLTSVCYHDNTRFMMNFMITG